MQLQTLLFVGLNVVKATCDTGDYTANLAGADHQDWMARVPDNALLSSLNILGTHETMTHKFAGKLQCQNEPLETQLHAGVRYIDTRTRLVDNELRTHHSDEFAHYTSRDVLGKIIEFLNKCPRESLVMHAGEEKKEDFDPLVVRVTPQSLAAQVLP